MLLPGPRVPGGLLAALLTLCSVWCLIPLGRQWSVERRCRSFDRARLAREALALHADLASVETRGWVDLGAGALAGSPYLASIAPEWVGVERREVRLGWRGGLGPTSVVVLAPSAERARYERPGDSYSHYERLADGVYLHTSMR